MIQVNRIYLIFNRLVTKKFLVDTSDFCLLRINRPTVVELSSDSCRTIIQQLSDDNITIVGRIDLSKTEISWQQLQ